MVIDTSAILAILQEEPECAPFLSAIENAEIRVVSAATAVEISMIALARQGEAGLALYRELAGHLTIDVVPVNIDHVELAIDAFRRYGKGRHPAALNFGDCFSYALAKATDQPLLFKGEDFGRTDIGRLRPFTA